jgi:hypothetical protein
MSCAGATRKRLVVLLLALLLSGCVARRWHFHVFPRCADGLPVEILIDPACPLCNYLGGND